MSANSWQRFGLGYGIYWDKFSGQYVVTDTLYNQATFSDENGDFVWAQHAGSLSSPQSYSAWLANIKMMLRSNGELILGTDPGGSDLLRIGGSARVGGLAIVTTANSQPIVGPVDNTKQFGFGDLTKGAFILVDGTASSSDKGDVLLTGHTGGGSGCVKIRTYDGTTTLLRSTFTAEGGLMVGNPSGGAGAGNINVSGDVFKNGSAYTNPDYVFELAYEGKARSPAPKDYRLQSLAETEQFTREHFHLPGISREASGAFARTDMVLEKVEELFLHAFAQEHRLLALEDENRALRAQVDALSR
ncbi:MAG: hypothetical protein HY700_14805 [Gemmatimonadetes bacterium]|nr:hypothetical protein [Gemmatimonadota bacterium]